MTKPNIITKGAGKTKASRGLSLGRPRVSHVKDHWISFRVTAEEYFALITKAERSSMSAGEYARSRSMRGIARAKKTSAAPVQLFGDDTNAILHELRKQGVNLNQIAHHCNRHQIPPPPELASVIASLQALWRDAVGQRSP